VPLQTNVITNTLPEVVPVARVAVVLKLVPNVNVREVVPEVVIMIE